MNCIDCKYLNKIKNTEDSRQGICSYSQEFIPVCIDNDCVFVPKPYTCKDCSRFNEDFACYTAKAEDPVERNGRLCAGFIDKRCEEMLTILSDWKSRGYDIEMKIKEVVEDFYKNYRPLN